MKNIFSPKYKLSVDGLESLKAKLENLKKERLLQIENVRLLKDQQSDGLSVEDSSYIEAVDKLRCVEDEIERCEEILAHAKILTNNEKLDHVELGSKVRLKAGNREIEYQIVESIEADPSSGKISDQSPLGQQLIGKRLRDRISLKTLRGKNTLFRLVSIS